MVTAFVLISVEDRKVHDGRLLKCKESRYHALANTIWWQ